MAYREGPLSDIKVPLTWTAGAAAVLAALIALGVLLSDKREVPGQGGFGRARNEFDEVVQPVANVLASPVRWAEGGADYVGGYFLAVSENRRLKARVAELERWRDAAVALKNVNSRYESLLQLKTEPPIPMVAARVVSDARGPFSNARLADAGLNEGVREGYPVVSDHGAVGRIVGAAPEASRILLLTDADSRTPVVLDRSDSRAILTGDGGPAPRLEYLRGGKDAAREGDLVLTSGDGGVFPRGLPVGTVTRDLRGAWRVRLYADRQSLDYVRVLAFRDFGQLTDVKALSQHVMPPLAAREAAAVALAANPAPAPPATATSPLSAKGESAANKISPIADGGVRPPGSGQRPARGQAPVGRGPSGEAGRNGSLAASALARGPSTAEPVLGPAGGRSRGRSPSPSAMGRIKAVSAQAKAKAKPKPALTPAGAPRKPIPYTRLTHERAPAADGGP